MKGQLDTKKDETRHKWISADKNRQPSKAIFLDRDGVVVDDVHYLSKIDDIRIRPGLRNFLEFTKEVGYLNIIITNQSGIRRGYYTWNEYEKINESILDRSGAKNYIDAIYANDGLVVQNKESWRKPGIGMIQSAKNDLGAEIEESVIVGDRLSDLLCGANAGIRKLYYMQPSHRDDNERDEHEYLKSKCDRNIQLVTLKKVYSLETIRLDLKREDI